MAWVLSIIGITGLIAVGRHKWWGFAIGLCNECLWVWFAITREEYGLILGAVMYGTVNLLNALRWRNNADSRQMETVPMR